MAQNVDAETTNEQSAGRKKQELSVSGQSDIQSRISQKVDAEIQDGSGNFLLPNLVLQFTVSKRSSVASFQSLKNQKNGR